MQIRTAGQSQDDRESAIEPLRPGRRAALAGAALLIFASFGTFVALASDDTGVHDFIRRESRSLGGPETKARLPAIFTPPARPGSAALGYASSGGPAATARNELAHVGRSLASGNALARSARIRQDAPRQTKALSQHARGKASDLPASGAHTGELPSRQGATYCVRLCDGYFFPLSRPGATMAELQTSCSNLCPAARTRLYSAPAGSAGIDQARSRSEPYTNLPTAFLHRTAVSKACTCTAVGYGLETQDTSTDATFRRGDVLVLEDRLKVYRGRETGRNRENDFMPVETSSLLTRAERRQLSALVLSPAPRDQQKQPMRITALDPALGLTPLETQGAARFERVTSQGPIRIVRQDGVRPDLAQHP